MRGAAKCRRRRERQAGLSLLAPTALGAAKDAPPCGQATAPAPAKAAASDKKHRFPGMR